MNLSWVLVLLLVIGLLFCVTLYVAPGVIAKEPIPSDRLAWVDTTDGLSRCYYNTLTANWVGCVRR